MNRVNPTLSNNRWDDIRTFLKGVVTNGRVILLILVCFGAFFMSRGLQGLAGYIGTDDEPDSNETLRLDEIEREDGRPMEEAEPIEPPRTLEDAIEESDERIDGHRRCTYTEYKRANEEECAELQKGVDDATKH